MELKVKQEACIGCGACVANDPAHFEFDEQGLSHVISQENLDSENVKTAIESCPTSAIALEENEECHCEHCDCHKEEGE